MQDTGFQQHIEGETAQSSIVCKACHLICLLFSPTPTIVRDLFLHELWFFLKTLENGMGFADHSY